MLSIRLTALLLPVGALAVLFAQAQTTPAQTPTRSAAGARGAAAPLEGAPQTAAPTALGVAYIRENYSKFEYKIPMRDGVKLFTSVYMPKDVARGQALSDHAERTPYSVRHMAWISIRPAWGRRSSSPARNSSSSIRTCAAAT